MHGRRFLTIVGASGLVLAAVAASAQTRPPSTEQLGRDPGALRQEAEQQRAQQQRDQQQQSQQQADQQWNDTVRRQQSRANADAAQGEAVRRSWAQRPPLAADKNPLLGRWDSLGTVQRASAPGLPPELARLAAELVGGMKAGLCDSMLGRGTIEFRSAGVFAIDRNGRERPMYRAEYRGGGSRVVVLPQGGTTFTHMIVDFDGADHATVAAVGCGLRRAGAGSAGAAMTNTALGSAESGAAEQWTHVGTSPLNGGADIYAAPASIRRSADRAWMANLFDFKTPQVVEGKAFRSLRLEYEYDCTRRRERLVASRGFKGPMGKGPVSAFDDHVLAWQPVAATGLDEAHWEMACKRR